MFFSNVFNVKQSDLDAYGAFNISLVNDVPLFIDPFLLFNSPKIEYKLLHDHIIKYVVFLKDETIKGTINEGLIGRWFTFSEVKQNWLGFCLTGNSGSGLGKEFANTLHKNFTTVLKEFGTETVTDKSHIEKLCLFKDGIGKDNISDFTTNLIKKYLLEYTQTGTSGNSSGVSLQILDHLIGLLWRTAGRMKWVGISLDLPIRK